MVEHILYMEGGGDSKALRSKCREGVTKLLERAGCKGRMPRIVACGGHSQAFESFETHSSRTTSTVATLLVDAEAPVHDEDPWAHVAKRKGDGWQRPPSATADQLHLMVQLMETWLVADRQTLSAFFGQGFRESALPDDPRIEEIAKADVMKGLRSASYGSRKGEYGKGAHSFDLLGRIDPRLVEAASPWARRFFEHMRRQA